MARKYVIITAAEVSSVDFSRVLEDSQNTLRYNSDESKTFVKFEGDTPSFLEGKTLYTLNEIREELKKDEWKIEDEE